MKSRLVGYRCSQIFSSSAASLEGWVACGVVCHAIRESDGVIWLTLRIAPDGIHVPDDPRIVNAVNDGTNALSSSYEAGRRSL